MGLLLGVLAVAVVVTVSVAAHEAGHWLVARRLGVGVATFRVGLGPTVATTTRGGTTFQFGLLPVGGGVRLHGVVPPRQGRTGKVHSRIRALLLRNPDARVADREDASALWPRPARHKMAIALAGPAASLLLALVLLTVLLSGLGVPVRGLTVGAVAGCVPYSTTPGSPCVPGSHGPAQAAGVLAGDTITAVGGHDVDTWSEVLAELEGADAGSRVALTVDRSGREITASVTTAVVATPVVSDDGQTVLTPSGAPVERPGAFLGVSPAPEYEREPISAVPGAAWSLAQVTVSGIAALPVQVAGSVQAAFTDEPRTVDDPASLVGVTRFAGQIAGSDAPILTAGVRLRLVIALAIAANVLLAVANLIPLPPLDGGDAAGAAWEGTRRRVATWRGRPDPGPVDPTRAVPFALAFLLVAALASAALTLADVLDPIRPGGS